jgi:hypothetical protein
VSSSSGDSVRGSTISAEIPSASSCSAAAKATRTIELVATIVTSSPSRLTSATPSGIRKSSSSGTSPLTV